MSFFDQLINLPCPPDFSDYEVVAMDSVLATPTAGTLGKFQRANKGTDFVVEGCLMSYNYETGESYFVGCEGFFTNANFFGGVQKIWYWSPTDWPGSPNIFVATGVFSGEDVPPYNCPYPDKLNVYEPFYPAWVSGNRGIIEATETGLYRVLYGSEVFV